MKKYFQITLVLGLFFFLVLIRNLQKGKSADINTSGTTSNSNNQQTSQQTTTTIRYKDGTYTGSTEDAYYGNIQVQATITNGKVSDITFLQYPNDNRTSQSINTQAMPMLKSEALLAQNAQVDIVSGASDSSMAFQRSLATILTQAKQ